MSATATALAYLSHHHNALVADPTRLFTSTALAHRRLLLRRGLLRISGILSTLTHLNRSAYLGLDRLERDRLRFGRRSSRRSRISHDSSDWDKSDLRHTSQVASHVCMSKVQAPTANNSITSLQWFALLRVNYSPSESSISQLTDAVLPDHISESYKEKVGFNLNETEIAGVGSY